MQNRFHFSVYGFIFISQCSNLLIMKFSVCTLSERSLYSSEKSSLIASPAKIPIIISAFEICIFTKMYIYTSVSAFDICFLRFYISICLLPYRVFPMQSYIKGIFFSKDYSSDSFSNIFSKAVFPIVLCFCPVWKNMSS